MNADMADLRGDTTAVKSRDSDPVTLPQPKPKLTTYQPLHVNLPPMRSTPVSSTEPRVVSPVVTTNNIRAETTSRHRSTVVSNKASS